jgi:broad specificity phosphatase PhoE
MKIILIRHGQTEANVKNLVCGQIDTDLTVLGAQQCNHLAVIMRESGIKPKRVFSSDLRRAKISAELIFPNAEEIVCDPRLRETDTGDYSNLTFSQLHAMNPLYKREGNIFDTKYPNGESIFDLYNRVVSSFLEVTRTSIPDKDFVFVVHGGTINCILHYLFSVPLDLYPAFKMRNASYSIVQLPDGVPQLEVFNMVKVL